MNKLDRLRYEISNNRNWEDVGSTHVPSKRKEFQQRLLDIINDEDEKPKTVTAPLRRTN